MKKLTSLMILTASLFITSLSFISCGFLDGTEEEYADNRPDIENTETSIKISAPRLSEDTQYINIYRREVLDSEAKTYGDIYNIGILYTSEFDANNASYMYEDVYVVKGHEYQYRARYYDKVEKDYYNSGWTAPVTAQCGVEKESDLTVSADTVYFLFNDELYPTMKLCNSSVFSKSDVFNKYKADGYSPALALQTDEKTQIFNMDDEFFNGTTTVNLLSYLPKEFYNKKIKILGIVLQKVEQKKYEDGTLKDKRIYWSKPIEVKLIIGSSDAETFEVTSVTGTDGTDFSTPAAKIDF